MNVLQRKLDKILLNKKTEREKRANRRTKNKPRRRKIVKPIREFIDNGTCSRNERCFAVEAISDPDALEKEQSTTKLPALKSKNEMGKYHEDFFRHAETQAKRVLNNEVTG